MYPNPYEANPYGQNQPQPNPGTNPNPNQNPPPYPNPYQQTAYGGQPSSPNQYAPVPPPPNSPNQYDKTLRADDPAANQYSFAPQPQNPNQYPNQYQGGAPASFPPAYNPSSPNLPPGQMGQSSAGRPSNNKRILLIVIVLIVVIAGSVLAFTGISLHNTQVANDNSTATAQTNNTATARTNATATAQAKVTATAQAVATATAVASTYPFSATQKLNDPLTTGVADYGWSTNNNCQFSSAAYHDMAIDTKTFIPCYAAKTSFSNFTYEVTMQINKGDIGGITFRGDDANYKFYAFVFDTTGAYAVYLYTHSSNPSAVTSGTSSSFHTGAGQSNVLAVVARDNKFTLYVNGVQETSTIDSTYTSGQVGMISYDITSQADVSFTNAKVWTL